MRRNIDFKKIRSIYFIGIGGIGVSALAKMALLYGKRVYGSDKNVSPVTEKLAKDGAKIFIGHTKNNIPKNIDAIIYTIAIPKDNPELKEAEKRKIPLYTYPQALGFLSREKETIAIAGTHGKTTTTAMVHEILSAGKKAPTTIVGSFLNGKRENFITGKGKYFVVEACEYGKSFMNLSPKIAVITNIDNDHLDYYKTLDNVIRAFCDFARKVPKNGHIIANLEDQNIRKALRGVSAPVIDYTTIRMETPLSVLGEHNRKNAQAAYATGKLLKISDKSIRHALKNFKGTWRRQEYKGKTAKGALIYDDYAHHPTEIKATLAAFRDRFPKEKITIVFQPHLYSRTKFLFDGFTRALSAADSVFILPIYAAREKPTRGVTGEKLAMAIKKKNPHTLYIESFAIAAEKLSGSVGKNDIVITIGAGDVYIIGKLMLDKKK